MPSEWWLSQTCLQSQVVGMLLIAEICLTVAVTTALANDLTEEEPPAQVQEVDHDKVPLLSPLTVVHWEPELAADSPQRSWYTV
jgi:hypothetical protein